MTADEFTAGMLRELRRDFFAKATDKQFYQERDLLLQAIAYPARYLNDRGASAVASKYQQILRTVIGVIKAKGNRGAIHSFSRYFLYCVQEHMSHHGDEYYHAAKDPRAIGPLVDPALRRLKKQDAIRTTETIAAAHRALRLRSGRKPAKKPPHPTLF